MSVNNDNVNKSAIRSVAAKITSAFMGGSRSSSNSSASATNGAKHEAKDEKKPKQKAAAKIKLAAGSAKKVTSSKKATPKKSTKASKTSVAAKSVTKSAALVAKSVAKSVEKSVEKASVKAVVSKVADIKVTSDRATLPSSASDKRFSSGDYVVYPAHGLGRVSSVEPVSHGDNTVDVVSIAFERDRMVVKVPVYRIEDSGLRPVSSKESMSSALNVLRSKVRTRRVMWSRRAQEYQTKIYSGDPVSIAEVVRELHRESHQGEPSFSERQIYQSALDRLASEFAVVEKIDEESAARQLVEILSQAV